MNMFNKESNNDDSNCKKHQGVAFIKWYLH